jgi:hypothetical protein
VLYRKKYGIDTCLKPGLSSFPIKTMGIMGITADFSCLLLTD